MRTILVTGAAGFVGKNLCATLARRQDLHLLMADQTESQEQIENMALEADFVVHLAGVNRSEQLEAFQEVNTGLTGSLLAALRSAGKRTPFVLASSTQASLDNPYGRSKRAAEDLVFAYACDQGAPCFVYRFPNLFGKWCRPNYNSVVATFCHNIARGLPIRVDDENAPLGLVYVDDLVTGLIQALEGHPSLEGRFCVVGPVYRTSVGQLARCLHEFKAARQDLKLPDLGDPFVRKLYSTYLSYLPEDAFSYPLVMHEDARGSFTEFFRTPDRGQVSINISRPGITKGDHWHHSKAEKFLVVSGQGVIRFRRIGAEQVLEYPVDGSRLQVVDIPPGYTHHIVNLGDTDMVTVMWVNEPYDPARPDTYHELV